MVNVRCLPETYYRVSKEKKKGNYWMGGGYILRTRKILKKIRPFLSRSWIYLYNGERTVMIDKGVPFFSSFIDTKFGIFNEIMKFILHLDRYVFMPSD